MGDDKQVFNLAVQHCQLFDLEEPVKIEDINITQIANLAVDDAMKTRPLMEEKRMKKRNETVIKLCLGSSIVLGAIGILLYRNRTLQQILRDNIKVKAK